MVYWVICQWRNWLVWLLTGCKLSRNSAGDIHKKKVFNVFWHPSSYGIYSRHSQWAFASQYTQEHLCMLGLTCDWVLAAMALLRHISLVAVHTINTILMGGEASSCQRLMAGFAHKALRVPGLVLVADSSRGDGLRRGREEHFDHADIRVQSNIPIVWFNIDYY